jgi:hypothetical protein
MGSSLGPTSFTYQWYLDGTPIAGATASTYTVLSIDEGNTLTCAVVAINSAGSGAPATSPRLLVAVPHVARCPPATGRLGGTTLGPIRLGMSARQARHAYRHSSTRGQRYEDFFCLTPIGVRVGFASPGVLAGLRDAQHRHLAGHVIWASTSSAYYAIDGIRPGATIAAAGAALHTGRPFVIGRNTWYLAPVGAATAVLKVRRGLVQEVGIGVKLLTGGRAAQRRFLTSFR